ncbi:MAG: TRAP transporter large permease subunit [Desulfotignum sp.]|nr:TRAP transporter large permease subunit [Desulfotignum sp.]MCF8126217.1 TRAP transporter large permease subunit [Desulfotignum sp.]
MDPNNFLVIAMMLTFIALLFTGFPIAMILGGVSIVFTFVGYLSDMYFGTMTGLDYMTVGMVVNRIFSIMQNWIMVALPMFIFMGLMLDKSGIAESMMHSIQALFGKVRGGLAITVTLIGVILAASTGIIGASVVLLGLLSLPVMLEQNYSKSLATGTICGAGTLGILIPPSIMLVMMADRLGLPVGDLFMGALFPGVLLAALYIIYILVLAYFVPSKAPLIPNQPPMSFGLVGRALKTCIPPALLIFSVLGTIFLGIATPTEASGIGALGALLLTITNRRFNFKVLKDVVHDTFGITAYIFAIVIGATCFALVLRELGGDAFVENAITSLPFGPYGIIFFILGVVFILGFFLDWIEITLIILPLLAPIIPVLGIELGSWPHLDNPTLVWFAILVAVVLQTSFLTPPVGFAIFYLRGVCPPEIQLRDLYKGVIPFIILQLIGLILLLFYPEIILWLPSQVYQ